MDDAWLLYGESGSGSIGQLLHDEGVGGWQVSSRSDRRQSILVGGSCTLLGGQSLALEYLRYGHGFGDAEVSAYFAAAEAAASLPQSAMTGALASMLTASPPLLERNYLHIICQNSPLAADTYWRLMYTHNLDDDSGQLALYAEYHFTGRLSGFVMAVDNNGGDRREFGQLIDSRVQAGLRFALP